MKRIGIMIVLAALTAVSIAMATDNVWVIIDHLAPSESKTREVELAPGTTTVEVIPINASNKPNNISCELDNNVDGGFVQATVSHCLFNLTTTSNEKVSIKTTNNEDKGIEY